MKGQVFVCLLAFVVVVVALFGFFFFLLLFESCQNRLAPKFLDDNDLSLLLTYTVNIFTDISLTTMIALCVMLHFALNRFSPLL